MPWPTPTDYRHAIQDPRGALDDEELRGGEVGRDARGLPMLWSGNFASVYRVHCAATGKTWALKCFTRDVGARQERYRHIAAHLEAARLPFTVPFVYLERGIQVHGQWFPAVKMEWVEGQPLNRFVEESLEKPRMLRQLLDLWPRMAARLREAEIAHADLQHGNVLLVPAAGGKLALRLIDYDGMYVSTLALTQSGESGHANYQHPDRRPQRAYNAHVDRFSHLVIYCAVHCLLVGKRDLWQRFNNDENLLFREEDFRRPAESELFRTLWDIDHASSRALVGRLLLACGQPLEASPWLDQIVSGQRAIALARSERQAVVSLLAARPALPAGTAPLPPGAAPAGEGGPSWRELFASLEERAAPAGEGGAAVVPEAALTGTVPATAAGTVPLAAPPGSRVRAAGRLLAGGFSAAARRLDQLLHRLVGEENDVLRYFLWAVLPPLMFAAAWFATRAFSERPPSSEIAQQPPTGSAADLSITVLRPVERPNKEITIDIGNGVKLELVLIPAGEFLMGSPDSDNNAQVSEKPRHRVRITKPFYLGKYLVTQEQWGAVMGSNPSSFKAPKNPVETVSWDDCQQFLNRLNGRVGRAERAPPGNRAGEGDFRLPTEAQWEYACRAGSSTRYCFGDDESGLGEYAWFSANSGNTTHPVGEKKPNAWGLYDMHGNVSEWCADCYDDAYYANSPTDDPTGPATDSFRVLRGGSWGGVAGGCRSAYRYNGGSGARRSFLGLRVSRVVAEAVAETPSPESTATLRIQPVPPQTIEVGKPLSVAVSPESPAQWQGKVRFSLGADAPPGAKIDPQTGAFAWTPPLAEPAGQQEISVSATGPDGQTAQTSFIVTVTRPTPAPVKLPGKEIAIDLGNGVNLEMVLVPAGEFMMGSPDSDSNAQGDEKPRHPVRITKPFYLGKYLVTQEQWGAVMGSNPSSFKAPKNPVETVSWDDCQQFLNRLNGRVGRAERAPPGNRAGEGDFRLPTEAQWEYACRAGSTGKYCFGDSETQLGEYAWYSDNSGGKTHPVGEKKPNAWGLYDMHGNVWEWCQDWYNGGYYAGSPSDDPPGPTTGSRRVLRGGSWSFLARYCRSASRDYFGPGYRDFNLGLRVSRVLAE